MKERDGVYRVHEVLLSLYVLNEINLSGGNVGECSRERREKEQKEASLVD